MDGVVNLPVHIYCAQATDMGPVCVFPAPSVASQSKAKITSGPITLLSLATVSLIFLVEQHTDVPQLVRRSLFDLELPWNPSMSASSSSSHCDRTSRAGRTDGPPCSIEIQHAHVQNRINVSIFCGSSAVRFFVLLVHDRVFVALHQVRLQFRRLLLPEQE